MKDIDMADIDFCWRYGVVGVYKDREEMLIRIYPLPFVRITIRLMRKS